MQCAPSLVVIVRQLAPFARRRRLVSSSSSRVDASRAMRVASCACVVVVVRAERARGAPGVESRDAWS